MRDRYFTCFEKVLYVFRVTQMSGPIWWSVKASLIHKKFQLVQSKCFKIRYWLLFRKYSNLNTWCVIFYLNMCTYLTDFSFIF